MLKLSGHHRLSQVGWARGGQPVKAMSQCYGARPSQHVRPIQVYARYLVWQWMDIHGSPVALRQHRRTIKIAANPRRGSQSRLQWEVQSQKRFHSAPRPNATPGGFSPGYLIHS